QELAAFDDLFLLPLADGFAIQRYAGHGLLSLLPRCARGGLIRDKFNAMARSSETLERGFIHARRILIHIQHRQAARALAPTLRSGMSASATPPAGF
ncbi:hypothetical protein AB0096_26315, partial [Klebsiella pneumoniae]